MPYFGAPANVDDLLDQRDNNLSSSLVDAVKRFENFTPQATWDYRQYTNGYGTRGMPGEVIDRGTAEKRLRAELTQAAQFVDNNAPGLPQGVRDAMISLTFNAGGSWANSGLGEKLRVGDYEGAKQIFQQYNKAGGSTLPGLARRRSEEASWFDNSAATFSPQDNTRMDTTPSIMSLLQGQAQQQRPTGLMGMFSDPESMAYLAMIAKGLSPGSSLDPQAMMQLAQRERNSQFDRLLDVAKFGLAQDQANRPDIRELSNDPLSGQRTYGIVDRKTGQITPTQIQGQSSTFSGDENNVTPQNFGDLGKVPQQYGADGKDETFLKAVEQQYGAVIAKSVKDVTEGKFPAQGRRLQQLIPLASRYDQNFTGMQDYQTRLQTAKSFAGGRDAETVKSYNQAIIHADKAWNLIDKIGGVDVGGTLGKIINTPYGEMRAATNPQFASDRKEYTNLINALSGELMKASRGSGSGSLHEIQAWREGSLAANSPSEMRGAIRGAMDFLEGAMDASAQKKSQGMKSQFAPTDLLTDRNKQSFERIQGSSEGTSNKPSGARQAPDGNWYIPDPARPGKYLRVDQ